MIDFYPQILMVHIWAISLSGLAFFTRGLSSLMGQTWPSLTPVKMVTWLIDTVLLTAAVLLWTILPHEVFANHWLSVKLVLVAAYIGLGLCVMRPALDKRIRWAAYGGAALIYITIIGIARAHDPLGWLNAFIAWPG